MCRVFFSPFFFCCFHYGQSRPVSNVQALIFHAVVETVYVETPSNAFPPASSDAPPELIRLSPERAGKVRRLFSVLPHACPAHP